MAPTPPPDAAGKVQHGPGTQPSKWAGFHLPKAQHHGPRVPFEAVCLQPGTCSGLPRLLPERWAKHNGTESVSSQPPAFPRKGLLAGGRILGGWVDPPGGQQPPCKMLHIALMNAVSLIPSQGKARSQNTGVSCPPSWEQSPGQALLTRREIFLPARPGADWCLLLVRETRAAAAWGKAQDPAGAGGSGLLLRGGKRKGKGEANRGGEGQAEAPGVRRGNG